MRDAMKKRIKEILEQYPKTSFVIWTNTFHSRSFLRVLEVIPPENLKMIHLYEFFKNTLS